MAQMNVLLITTDQQAADTLGCMGNPVIRTPHIDALAADGVVFTNAFTSFPICTPARTTIFSGLYAKNHGVTDNVNMNFQPGPPGLPPEREAFPELLSMAGYETCFFGKLHARHEGGKNFGIQTMLLAEGKGHFVSSPDEEDDYRRYLREKGYGPEDWQTWLLPKYVEDGWVTSPLPEKDYIDTWIADRALEYLAQANEPFFCWVSFCTPHTPLDPPRPYDTLYDPAQIPLPHRREGELEEKPRRWVDGLARTIHAVPLTSIDPSLPGGIENAYQRFPLEKTQRMRAAYYGEVSHVDAQVGRLLELLKKRGLYERTLIVFTSDHGDYCGNNWAFYKELGLYDSLIRVPLVIRWPGANGCVRQRPELVSLVDLMPTILDATGVPARQPVDGCSLKPLLTTHATPPEWRQEVVVERGLTNAIVTRQWKLVLWNDGTEELYNRAQDPHDLYNLGSDQSLTQVRRRLRRCLEKWLAAR